jgi:hypothetical protein
VDLVDVGGEQRLGIGRGQLLDPGANGDRVRIG